MCRELNKAKSFLETAKYSWLNRDSENSMIDVTCLNIQLGIEICVKFIYTLQGERAPRTHDIRSLVTGTAAFNNYENKEYLLRFADMITSWHTASIYENNFIATTYEVNSAFAILTNLIEFIESFKPVEVPLDNVVRIQAILERNKCTVKFEDIKDKLVPTFIEDINIPIETLNTVVMCVVKDYYNKK